VEGHQKLRNSERGTCATSGFSFLVYKSSFHSSILSVFPPFSLSRPFSTPPPCLVVASLNLRRVGLHFRGIWARARVLCAPPCIRKYAYSLDFSATPPDSFPRNKWTGLTTTDRGWEKERGMGSGRRKRRNARSWLTEFAAWAFQQFSRSISCAYIRSFIHTHARCVCILVGIVNRAIIQFRERGSNDRREIRSRGRSARSFGDNSFVIRPRLHVSQAAIASRIYHPVTLIYLVIIPILVPREGDAPCNLQRVPRTVS